MDNLLFFRAQKFFGEPYLAEELLSRFDIMVSGGSTRNARGFQGNKTLILKTCGTNEYTGHFQTTEVTISYIQNLFRGVFVGIFMPARSIRITDAFCFNSIADTTIPVESFKKSGFGDMTLYTGWTLNYQDTIVLDYIDATLKVGIVIPTAPKKDPCCSLSIPLGYNGHPGITICADSSLGLFDWLTLGCHLETITFIAKKQQFCTQIMTSPCSSPAPCTVAKVHKGVAWQVGGYARADHLVRGLSGLIGYSYTQQRPESVSTCNTPCQTPLVLNSDSLCNGWSMHTIHVVLDYDFTKSHMKYGPRVGLFFDIQAGGKNIYTTNMTGGIFGLDIGWCY